jgi:hypothetical protein
VLASLLLASSAAVACLWDYDTLLAERARQPTTLELITGKFLRHSPRFYDWRRQDRLAKIEAGANAEALWDDLAVAYDKLGQHDQAIETARQRLIENPRRYETLANLGTFYLHSGQLQEGITTIDKALEVNPAAHFGRERIQRYLAEYILQRCDSQGKYALPLQDFAVGPPEFETLPPPTMTFAEFVETKEPADLEWRHLAIRGIQGMMRFGKHDSPVLLEALGSLLRSGPGESNENYLACRAYLKAARAVEGTPAANRYRELAENAIEMQVGEPKLADVEKDFARECQDADDWYEGLRAAEKAWIEENRDVDAEFARLYSTDPAILRAEADHVPYPYDFRILGYLGVATLAVIAGYLFGQSGRKLAANNVKTTPDPIHPDSEAR